MLFPYEAENADELTLEEGQIITIIDKVRIGPYGRERVHAFGGGAAYRV